MGQIRKVVLVIVGIIVMCQLQGQSINKKTQEKVNAEVEEMAEVMNLNNKQQTKLIELKTALRLKNQEVTKKYKKGSQAYKDAKKVNMKNYNSLLRKVCTKEQMSLWQAHRKAQRK
ncbi:hypothetical protein E9993_09560 [Labilibacter sediminis]|nr:hypothetical protein E9993_09560 [Labilibacter sediminis]